MTQAIQRRRGTTAEHALVAGLDGEITVDTDKHTVVVHDGVTLGGYPLQLELAKTLWVPTVGFETPGDEAIVYALQAGDYYELGEKALVRFNIQFTPTFTTAAGALRIGSLPFDVNEVGLGPVAFDTNFPAFPAGVSYLQARAQPAGANHIIIDGFGSGVNLPMTATEFVSGTLWTVRGHCIYSIL